MCLSEAVDKVLAALKAEEGLGGCVVIKAYPYIKKPTRMKSTVIAVSPCEAELSNTSLGGDRMFGRFTVRAYIYSPQDAGSPAENGISDSVFKALLTLQPAQITLSDFKRADVLGAFEAECRVSFNSHYGNKEDNNAG